MSSKAAIIDNYEALFASNSAVYAAYTLIFFEHILTFGDEVEVFWKRKFTGATVMFLLNRYLILVSYILELASVWIKSDYVKPMHLYRCMVDVRITDVFYYALYIPWAVFAALRAYALSNRNWPLAILVFLLGLVPYGMDMGQFAVGLTGYVDPVWGCVTAIPGFSQTLATQMTIAARTTHIACDAILIVVTWYSLRRRMRGISRLPLTATIVLVVLNSLRLILAMPLPVHCVLTVILVSHFLLDLQRASDTSRGLGASSLSYSDAEAYSTSTVVFDRVVGSMGASLEPATSADETEDSDWDHSSSEAHHWQRERGDVY
ncbi:hypothetical protein L227DRAFT_575166 [Lentinus tigrinus ALCF2SS1-6]|uniref:DUF6533 domain-containing protein n=1 Tax=Lentinus tigrinus ALCF2SS1-6 TaxID=1328759 RepID=A0A5C2SA09_9APHY|nr:hypothetical protein L227DRAFT_575166 [Lentinus tigrinus ALCF2SS1-6]